LNALNARTYHHWFHQENVPALSSWRSITNWGKQRPLALRLAERLGRSRGRLRLLENLNPPPAPRMRPDISHWEDHALAAAWIGHATVLLRIGGMTILTDPVMSNRVGVGLGLLTAGPRRFTAPALTLPQLPPIDLILISHAHFDHLDRPTLARLPKRTPVITAHQTQDLIRDLGFRRVAELRWGEQIDLRNGVHIAAHCVSHWGARTFYDRHRGFNAYAIESPRHRVLYGGDTAYHEGFREVGKVDLAILGIGAYDPYVAVHATPEQAWRMADHVRADHVLPMHHSTFRLSHEPMAEPIERMLSAAGGDDGRIVIREIGGHWALQN
jgi:L-ascorbate metabolism protein UlaG (beta-lactamase superfamily)